MCILLTKEQKLHRGCKSIVKAIRFFIFLEIQISFLIRKSKIKNDLIKAYKITFLTPEIFMLKSFYHNNMYLSNTYVYMIFGEFLKIYNI